MRKYKYMKIGIASPEEIVSWANPELQGKEFKYDFLSIGRSFLYELDDQYLFDV